MRVFLDTNVLISAFTTRGLCADLFRYVLARHEMVVGEVVLEELCRVLAAKFGMPSNAVAEIDDFVRGQARVVPRQPAFDVDIRDPDDALVLAAAAVGKAAVLVTGDTDLLDLAPMDGLEILTPRDFWYEVSR